MAQKILESIDANGKLYLSNILDRYTGEPVTYTQTSDISTDVQADGVIYRKYNNVYVKRNFQGAANIKWFGAKGDGITSSNAYIQKAQSVSNNILIPDGVFLIDANLTISSNIVVDGSFYITSGKVLTINGKLKTGRTQIFQGAGTVKFGVNSIEVLYSQWFANDNTSDGKASSVFNSNVIPKWVKWDSGIETKITDLAPELTTYRERIFIKGAGFENQAKGVGAFRIDVTDDISVAVDPTKAGILYGIVITIDPLATRSDVPNDDATGIIIQNGGTQKATDAFYVGKGSPAGIEWSTLFANDASTVIGFQMGGYYDKYGINFADGVFGVAPILLKNNSSIASRNAANNADYNLIKLSTDNGVVLGNSGSGGNVVKLLNSAGALLSLEVTSNATSETKITFSNSLTLIGGTVKPGADNTQPLGAANARWSTIFAGTAAINTSDEREKQEIKPINDAVLKAWSKVNYCEFKFNDSVNEKGDNARVHFGVIAQQVKESFESEGLNPFDYGVLCYDEWDSRDAVLGEDGEILEPAILEGNRYGVRYEEALVLECAYLRSRLK